MDTSISKFDKWQEEKALLDELRIARPDAFTAEPRLSRTILQAIGVYQSPIARQMGRIKVLPFDFIVEEIRKDGSVITADREETSLPLEEGSKTVFADMVKIGLSTLEAIEVLAAKIGCDKSQISYSGIKDTAAITAQKISIRNVSIEAVRAVQVPQLFLKNITAAKGAVQVGDLQGNRFTILVRTARAPELVDLKEKISLIQKNGLINYYGPQRFGSPRYLSHVFGKQLLRGDFQALVKTILWEESKFEWKFVTQLRQKARALNGNWKEQYELFSILPYVFQSELQILERLIRWDGTGDRWIHALGYAPEQIDFWPKSYASYLANQLLSNAERNRSMLPEQLPLLLNSGVTEEVDRLYSNYLAADGTSNFRTILTKIPYIRRGENSFLPTRIYPIVHTFKIAPEGCIISFDLPKGAYATTLLYELFDIDESFDVPENISRAYVDIKKAIGVGSFDSIYDWAKQYIA